MQSSSDNPSQDTIFALASGAGRAGVSILRVSGPKAIDVARKLTRASHLTARRASLRLLTNPETGGEIDKALVLVFEGPASFTGEDMVEFQVHGSPAVIESCSRVFYNLGLREARRGEFTRRAFENGRMDLTEAEGLADLIDAETEVQRAQAYRQMDGGLKRIYESWREDILDALASIEGEIDFPDEEDVPEKLAQISGPGLDVLAEKLSVALQESAQGERVRHGLDIAIIGAPNAGKSTIINDLTKKQAAIVSGEAGTTRDLVEVNMVIGGLPVRVTDTAGLRDTDNNVEAEGVRRARGRAEQADIRIGVIDWLDIKGRERAAADLDGILRSGDILALNKCGPENTAPNVSRETFSVLSLSAIEPGGTDGLRAELEAIIKSRFALREDVGLTRERHRDCVSRALRAVKAARQSLSIAPELAGEDLRAALHAIKELAGEADIEAVLDRIFTRFCIGK